MADSKLSALTAATTLDETDELYVNDSGTSKKITLANLRGALTSASKAELDFLAGIIIAPTGMGAPYLGTTAPAGWVLADDGTIGSGASGASTRANTDCEDLYTLIWESISDTYAPVTGGRGASAAADWAADKPIKLGTILGRALGVAGAGASLTARTLGQTVGAETHELTSDENGPHTHAFTTESSGAHTHNIAGYASGASGSSAAYKVCPDKAGNRIVAESAGAHTHTGTTSISGAGNAHNNMQPTTFMNLIIKL